MAKCGAIFIVLKVFLFSGLIQTAIGKHHCVDMALDTFCIIANHFKSIYQETNPNLYKQFQKIIDIFPDEPFQNRDLVKTKNEKQIYTYQTNCELDYVHGPFPVGNGSPGSVGHDKKNPYELNVTEIEVNGERMHNWLHITIKSNPSLITSFPGNKVTGKFKYVFLVVHDDFGFAVGDFNHRLPCGSDCNCKKPDCYQVKAKDSAIPCMYTQKNVITHPGMLMVYSGGETGDGVNELHATWHFAQYQTKDTFTPELHFKALVIESTDVINIADDNRGDDGSQSILTNGITGWNPRYNILWPKKDTVGAWDHFRTGVYDGSLIKCHKPIDPNYYEIEDYPSGGMYNPKDGNNPNKLTAKNTMLGSKHWEYTTLSQSEKRLFYGYWKPEKPVVIEVDACKTCKWEDKKSRSASRGLDGRRETTFPYPQETKEFSTYKTPKADTFDSDQCTCHALGTTQPPADVPPPPIQVQGRKAHATQMIIAWICLVPFGIFVARYYKETYSKVFFLQEFWWFTIHVLCFVVAAMFMFGGIYSLEIQRKDPIKWGDRNILLHVGIGSVAIGLFMLQILLGHQRMRNVNQRMLQIMLHWCFGFVEYILAISSMLLSGMILKGCLPCDAFYAIVIWVGVQIVFYVFMEIHMRFVDRELNLEPKRTYLPPPVMRVFHMNAPKSKLRIVMLVLYGICCTGAYATVHVLIKFNEGGESCFKFSPEAENVTERPLAAFHRRVHS